MLDTKSKGEAIRPLENRAVSVAAMSPSPIRIGHGDSPDLPNVHISPPDCAASTGNSARISELFLRNLEHWQRGAPLENEVHQT